MKHGAWELGHIVYRQGGEIICWKGEDGRGRTRIQAPASFLAPTTPCPLWFVCGCVCSTHSLPARRQSPFSLAHKLQ